jgi:aminoglycoside 2''-phosphotransferase
MDSDHYRRLIESAFPDVSMRTCEAMGEGWDAFVMDVNGELVFRFPKRQNAVLHLERAIRFLPQLADALPVAVPRYDFVSRDSSREPPLFVGYSKIKGLPLSRDRLSDAGVRRSLAQGLGETLTRLHGLSVDLLDSGQFQAMNASELRRREQSDFDYAQEHIMPLLSADARRRESEFWADYIASDANYDFDPVLIHGDIGADHVLCDYDQGRVVGIIDWDYAKLGDPASDFEHLLHNPGEEFVEQVLSFYDVQGGGDLVPRVRDHFRFHPYGDIRIGHERDFPSYVRGGLDAIEARQPTS